MFNFRRNEFQNLDDQSSKAACHEEYAHDESPYEKKLLSTTASMRSVSAVPRTESATQACIRLLKEDPEDNKYDEDDLDIGEKGSQSGHVLAVYPSYAKSKDSIYRVDFCF
jgi:hypothetical protein